MCKYTTFLCLILLLSGCEQYPPASDDWGSLTYQHACNGGVACGGAKTADDGINGIGKGKR